MNKVHIKKVIVGCVVWLGWLMVSFVLWGIGAANTDVFGDGCPDTYRIASQEWRYFYLYVLPLMMLLLSIYLTGFITHLIMAKRGVSPSLPSTPHENE